MCGIRWTLNHCGAAKECLQRGASEETPLAAYTNIYRGLNPSIRIRDDVDIGQLSRLAPRSGTLRRLQATLYPYQEVGYQWLSEAVRCRSGLLACR